MNYFASQTRAATSSVSTPKRKREETEREDQRRKWFRDGDEDQTHAEVVQWKLAFDRPHALSITKRGYRTNVGLAELRVGSDCETVVFDGTMATFRGCEMAALDVHFTLPTGHMRIRWLGKRIFIDDNYLIDEDGFHVTYRSTPRENALRSVIALVTGEYTEPMTLTFAQRSYIVRFEEGYPAIVLQRSTYYPLKLALMKDFVNKFVPRELFVRGPHTPERLADDSRLPPPTPYTPGSVSPSDNSSRDLTSPTRYTRNERHRARGHGYVDEDTDE